MAILRLTLMLSLFSTLFADELEYDHDMSSGYSKSVSAAKAASSLGYISLLAIVGGALFVLSDNDDTTETSTTHTHSHSH